MPYRIIRAVILNCQYDARIVIVSLKDRPTPRFLSDDIHRKLLRVIAETYARRMRETRLVTFAGR